MAEWTAAYWQWGTAIPMEGGNPLFDPAGAYCNKEQDEAVFFLPDSMFIIIIDEDPLPHAGCEVPCGKPDPRPDHLGAHVGSGGLQSPRTWMTAQPSPKGSWTA